jgi:hypothetical protein
MKLTLEGEARHPIPSQPFRIRSFRRVAARRLPMAALLAAAILSGGGGSAWAQADPFIAPVIPAVPIAPAGFDITGFIQEATLDTKGAVCTPTHPRLAGGTVTLNGQKVIIPCNTILQMPAFTMSYADLFKAGSGLAPTDITPNYQTGLALTDKIGSVYNATIPAGQPGLLTMPTPGPSGSPAVLYNGSLPSYEMHIQGNVVNGRYIAGLVFVSQQAANAGQGVISCIDYNTGELQVGGMPVDPTVGAGCPSPLPPGATRVRLNDTIGRYGKSHAPMSGCGTNPYCVEEAGFDPRFTPDTDNPTVQSASGYPMCIPRMNPFVAGAVDPECPQSNRPIAPNCKNFAPDLGITVFPTQTMGYCTTYVMDPPNAAAPAGVTCPGPDPTCPTDPTKQVPFEIGDNITFQGTLKADAAGVYVSAHTVLDNVGIYTQPGVAPAYTSIETVLAGTDGRPVAGLSQEATGRVKFVGFTTDISTLVDLFAVDQDPMTGAVTERLLGTQSAISSPLLGRFRTPVNNLGAFAPPTRNYRAVARTMCSTGQDTICLPGARPTLPVANGLSAGQYLFPNFEFIFAENLTFGQPLVPNNLQDLPFLFCGSGPLDGPGTASPVVGQLDPAPWAPPMDDPIFHSSLCPTALAVGAPPVFPPVDPATADTLTFQSVQWVNRGGRGKVNMVVTSSATPAPAGMFVTATISNNTLADTVPGSTANPIVANMILTGNSPATPGVCPTNDQCWGLILDGVIVNPAGRTGNGVPFLVPPTTITVRSSLGGTATANADTIVLKQCVPSRRLSCL